MLSSKSKRGGRKRRGRGVYISVSFLTLLLLEVDKVVAELGYWPNRATFVREAIMQKLDKCKKEIEALEADAERPSEGRKHD